MKKIDEYKDLRDLMVDTIIELANESSDVVMLDADLAGSIGSKRFQSAFPERYYNCGIAEANMIGVAAGLSSMDFRPFCHTFGCFASRRVFDQFFLSVGYAKQVVHLIGSDPGITAESNGGTHMPFEDIALMREVPGLVIIEPSDAMSAYTLMKQVYLNDKPSYIRMQRKGISKRYKSDEDIILGKGLELSIGEDVAIIATGSYMVDQAQMAVKELQEKGIQATLVDLHTIKPLDTELIEKVAKRCGKVLVCENGRYAGGIGEMIASHLVQCVSVKMGFVNVGEVYGEVGDMDYLAKRFGLTCGNIVNKAIELLK
jgi:transketolase